MQNNKTASDWMWNEISELLQNGVPASDIAEAYNISVTDIISMCSLEPSAVLRDFVVPVEFRATGFVKVKAISAEDAIDLVKRNEAILPIPADHRAMPENPDIKLRFDISPRIVTLCTSAYNTGSLTIKPEPTAIESAIATPELSPCSDTNRHTTRLNTIITDTNEYEEFKKICNAHNWGYALNYTFVSSSMLPKSFTKGDSKAENACDYYRNATTGAPALAWEFKNGFIIIDWSDKASDSE